MTQARALAGIEGPTATYLGETQRRGSLTFLGGFLRPPVLVTKPRNPLMLRPDPILTPFFYGPTKLPANIGATFSGTP